MNRNITFLLDRLQLRNTQKMKLFLPLLVLALAACAYGAAVNKVEESEPTDVADEGDEYRWKKKLGKTLENVGKWLQGKYAAVTDEEREEFELLSAELQVLAANVAEDANNEEGVFDELDNEGAAYGWGKWRKKIFGGAKKVAQAVVINKVAGAVGGVIG